MRENTALDDKLQGETRKYGFDWTPYLGDGVPQGEPLEPEALYGAVTVEANTVEGNVQTLMLSGGTLGPVALLLGVNTDQNELLEQVVTLTIL